MVLYEWLNARIGLAYATDFKALGRVVDKNIIGVVGYTGHTGASCQMHMAGDGPYWVNRQFLRRAFALPFLGWGYQVVLGIVPSGNAQALDMDKRLGFTEVATIEGAHPDGALHILEMRKENCRWVS